MKKNLLIVLMLSSISALAQKNYWRTVSSNEARSINQGKEFFSGSFKPSVYKLFSLNETDIASFLKQTPLQSNMPVSKSNYIISLPVADGSIEHFRIVESPVMQSNLQAKHPDIRTYLGTGIENTSSVLHFDFSPQGFHAIIISPKKATVYINPVNKQKKLYTVFDRSNISQEKQVFNCALDKVLNSPVQGSGKPGSVTSDSKLRTYRFAVTVGGEFSQLCLNGTETTNAEKKASVLAVLVTDLVRTNAIFETDFGVHLNYIDNEDDIIFLDPAKDPFTSNANAYNTGKWNRQAQKTLDSIIGSDNYDIGHLLMGFSTGGDAGCIGCVCENALKGSGVTGFTDDLTTDPFIVDYWDHEIGHQFGGTHTFDYAYEGTGTQMEPGSGSTIMGYAGVTGATDVQNHSDAYFHAISIQQIDTYITSGVGAGCAVAVENGNTVPTVYAGGDHIIPKSTPFVLEAIASDFDHDQLTYCWEQFNTFKNNGTSNTFPKSTSTTGPVFRSYSPVNTKTRFFPVMASILNGANKNKWEVLPSVSRKMNFRVTVRDNHAGGGTTNSDNTNITVDGQSGPFKVTSPNSPTSFAGLSTQTVTWDVANTDAAPVNCQYVSIILLYGQKNRVIIDSTPNDGTQDIIIPNVSTDSARIMIKARQNVFFDVSDSNFSIAEVLPVSWLSFTAERAGKFDALLNWSTANEINNDHFEVERSNDGKNFIKMGSVAAGPSPNLSQNYSYTDAFIPSGTNYYRIKQLDRDGNFTYSKQATVIMGGNTVSWSVQPNPAADHTTVRFYINTSNVNIYLTDASGRIVYKKILHGITVSNELNIPMNNLAKGVYMLHIKAGNETRTEKIVKE